MLTLSVDPAWRRRGIGTRLLAEAVRLAAAHGAGELVLTTRADNQAVLPVVLAAGLRGRIKMSGDRLTVHSGLIGMEGSIQRLAHWILDPESGKPWATSMAVAATLDLDARKIVPVSPAARKRLNAGAIPDLTL